APIKMSRSFMSQHSLSPSSNSAYSAAGLRKGISGFLSRGLALNLLQQPGAGVGPEVIGRSRGNAEQVGGLLDRQAAEVAQLDQVGGLGIRHGQLGEGFIQGEEIVGYLGTGNLELVECLPLLAAAAFAGLFAAGLLDEDAAH